MTTGERIVSTGRRAGLIRVIVIVSALLVLVLLVNQVLFYRAYTRFAQQDLALVRLAGRIVHLDEVLTMSARMAATTGDRTWADRYRAHEPELGAVLAEAIALAPIAERADIRRVDGANRALVERELEALRLAEEGRLEAAGVLVFDGRYGAFKREYRAGVDGMLSHFDRRTASSLASARRWTIVGGLVAVLAVAGSVVLLWLSVARSRREASLLDELAAAERRSTLGRMAASLAHELNQPLGAIVNYTGAAKEHLGVAGGEVALGEAIERAGAQAQRAGEIVRRMREFSRPSLPTLVDVDAHQAIRSSVQLVEGQARARRVTIEHEANAPPSAVQADPVQVQQVLVNLLLNAIDASPDGGVVRVGVVDGETHAAFEVADEGSGVTPEQAGRIFEAFYTTKPQGQGLGLSICRDIVEGLGGAIEVGAHGPGAVFRVRLPKGR